MLRVNSNNVDVARGENQISPTKRGVQLTDRFGLLKYHQESSEKASAYLHETKVPLRVH